MNFKTTLLLLVLAAAVGAALYFTNKEKPAQETEVKAHKLVDMEPTDVTRIDLKSDDGHIVLEKVGMDWKLTQPVAAAAKSFSVDDLVRGLVTLESRGKAPADAKDDADYTVELTSKGGKTAKLAFSGYSKLGDALYVRVGDESRSDVVANSVYAKLKQPVAFYRETKLISTPSTDIKQVSINSKGKTIRLEKLGDSWQIVEPVKWPADSTAVFDVLSGITGLNANDFVDSPSAPSAYGLDRPRMTVTYSLLPPTTQPTTSAADQTVKFGAPTYVMSKDIFVAVNDKLIATTPESAAKSLEKTPLDLRNKELVSINPDLVSRIVITTVTPPPPVLGPALPPARKPATEPTTSAAASEPTTKEAVETPATKPASVQTQLTLERRKAVPASTQPAGTQPATTQAATKPAEPQSKWVIAGDEPESADDAKITELLTALNPFKVEKFTEAQALPGTIYILKIQTVAGNASASSKDYIFTITDTGGRISGIYDDATFDLDRAFVTKLKNDFKPKPGGSTAAPSPMPMGIPGHPNFNLPPGQ